MIGPPLLVEDNIPVQKAVHAARKSPSISGRTSGRWPAGPCRSGYTQYTPRRRAAFPGNFSRTRRRASKWSPLYQWKAQAGHHVVGAAIDLGAGPVEEPPLLRSQMYTSTSPRPAWRSRGVEVFRQNVRPLPACRGGLSQVWAALGSVLHAEGGDVHPPVPVILDVTAQIPGPRGG